MGQRNWGIEKINNVEELGLDLKLWVIGNKIMTWGFRVLVEH